MRSVVLVGLALVMGLALRVIPELRDPGIQFLVDAAYHARLAEAAGGPGGLPALDRMSEAPVGRPTGAILPTGLYLLAAGFERAFGAPSGDERPLLLLMALIGALVVVPVYASTSALFADRRAAAVSALVAAVLPAHVARTADFWLRYDGLGTLLLTAHAAFAFRALTADHRPAGMSGKRSWWPDHADAAASALFLLAATWVWRVALIVPWIETAYVAARFLLRGAEPGVRRWFSTLVLAGTIGFPAIEYLRVQRFVFSTGWLLAVLVVVTLWLPLLDSRGRAVRAWTLAAIGGIAWLVGSTLAPLREYGAISAMLGVKLAGWFHVPHSPDPRAALMLDVEELQGLTPFDLLVAPRVFFVLGTFFFVAPLLLWARAGRPRGAALDPGPAAGLLAALSATLWCLALLFQRNTVLLAPFVAMIIGALLARRRSVSQPAPAKRDPHRRKRAPEAKWAGASGRRRPWLDAVLILGIVATAACGVMMATSRRARLDPALEDALRFLRQRTPSEAIVLGLWDAGYDIQRYATRATVVDGLLESPVNQERILAYEAALMADGLAPLLRLCRRDQASYLIVPRRVPEFFAMVRRQDPALAEKLRVGEKLTDRDLNRGLFRLLTDPAHVAPFEPVFQNGGFQMFRLATSSSG
jgi:hypothetical protein